MAKKVTMAAQAATAGRSGQGAGSGQHLPTLWPIRDRPTVEAIMDAVEGLDVSNTPAWSDLDALSSNTHFDGVELLPEGIFATRDGGFAAVATVYVGLNYGGKNDGVSTSDEFPAHVNGHFEADGKAVVDSFEVDTSSFYA